MTRKEAIEIVVANVKMGWMVDSWTEVMATNTELRFYLGLTAIEPRKVVAGWYFPRKWLKEKGYL